MLVMSTSLALLAKNEKLPHHNIDEIGMAFAHAHVASSMMIHHHHFVRSPHREPTVSSQLPLIARSSHSPPGIETFFPVVLKHSFLWYWNILSSGIETFFPAVLKHWNTPWYKKNQACGWFSNSYCPFQHSTFPILICLQQSSLSRFKKDLHWLFESKYDLE